MRLTRRCATLSAPARPRLTIFVSEAPAVALLSVAAQPDLQRRRPLDAGALALACQPEVRTCRAANRLSGSHRRDRGRAPTPASAREATRSHRAGMADGAGRGSLPGDAWRLVSRICDFCRRDRRRAPVRYAKTAHGLPRSCPSGTLDRRYDPTEGPHLSGQPAGAAGAHRGGLDIPLSRESQRDLESAA